MCSSIFSMQLRETFYTLACTVLYRYVINCDVKNHQCKLTKAQVHVALTTIHRFPRVNYSLRNLGIQQLPWNYTDITDIDK
jgi:hypothetical protein